LKEHRQVAGSWRVEGRVWVVSDFFGYGNYWMNTSSSLQFTVIDNISPNVPLNFSVSPNTNWNPHLTWNPSTALDVLTNTTEGYLIERRLYSNASQTWSNWIQIAAINGSSYSYTDTEISNASGAGPSIAEYRFRAKDINGNTSVYSSFVSVRYGISAQKRSEEQFIVSTNTLGQNYPNPFNPTTSISYCLKEPGYVYLNVYDLLGKEVAVLINESQNEGYHTVNFNASNLPSGIYVYKLNLGSYTEIRKMQLIK
jgi:hypothetical protein